MGLLLWQVAKVAARALFMLFCAFVCFLYCSLVYYPAFPQMFNRASFEDAWEFTKRVRW